MSDTGGDHIPPHCDFSHVTEEQIVAWNDGTDSLRDQHSFHPRGSKGPAPRSEQTFPVRLHCMLTELVNDGLDHIASWQPHGRCFNVHDPEEFVKEVLPLWFRQTKIESFQRQLNLYGFRRITSGYDRGSYYHEMFLRGKVYLSKHIRRSRIKGSGPRKPDSPESEPNFYSMRYCFDQKEKTAHGAAFRYPELESSGNSAAPCVTQGSPSSSLALSMDPYLQAAAHGSMSRHVVSSVVGGVSASACRTEQQVGYGAALGAIIMSHALSEMNSTSSPSDRVHLGNGIFRNQLMGWPSWPTSVAAGLLDPRTVEPSRSRFESASSTSPAIGQTLLAQFLGISTHFLK